MERYKADWLVSMSQEPIPDGVVDVDEGVVVWLGPAGQAPQRPGLAVSRIEGILMPGMLNIHCHTPMLLLRGAGEGLPVDRWLHEVMWPREKKLTPEDVRVGMLEGAAELLSNGITTSVEMYFHGDALAEGATEVGMRTLITDSVIEEGPFEHFGSWEKQLESIAALHNRWNSHDLVEIGIGPHAAYSVSEPGLRKVAELQAETGMLVHTHVNEQEWELAAVREQTGREVTDFLEDVGLLEGRMLAAHAVWMSDHDIEVLARNQVGVAHCPCSNTKHASGIARVDDMSNAGIEIGIATDGPASHHRLDLFEEMRTAIRLHRVRRGDAQWFPALRALRMVTAGAADAIGRSELGRLQVGAPADMVALSFDYPALHPIVTQEYDPVARIVWTGSPAAVQKVWVAGRQVVNEGRVTTIDQERVRTEMTGRARGLAV